MNEALIAAISAGGGALVAAIGKVIVDIINAKKQPDNSQVSIAVEELTEKVNRGFIELDQKFNESNNYLEEVNQKINDNNEKWEEINLVELRHSITEIYYEYCDQKSFSHNMKEDVCSLYAAYVKLGGNSYVHEIYEEMMDWEVK